MVVWKAKKKKRRKRKRKAAAVTRRRSHLPVPQSATSLLAVEQLLQLPPIVVLLPTTGCSKLHLADRSQL